MVRKGGKRGRQASPKSALGQGDATHAEQLSTGEVEREATDSPSGRRLTSLGNVTSPGASAIEKVGGELLAKFEMMFIQYQMDVNRATTEAIQDAMNTVRKDVKGLGERVSKVESSRKRELATAKDQRVVIDAAATAADNEKDEREEEQTVFDQPAFGGRKSASSLQLKPINSDKDKYKFKIIRDWGLKFDGSSKSIPIERFLFRVETLQRRHGISPGDLYSNFHLLLSGAAQEWFWMYMEEKSGEEGDGFDNLREALLDHFRKADCDEEILQAMNERKQDVRESFDDFYTVVRGMALTMKTKLPELSLVNLMRRNLKPRIKNLVFGCNITTLSELKSECRRAEKHFAEYDQKFTKRRDVDELDLKRTDECRNASEGTAVEAFERKGHAINRNKSPGKSSDTTTKPRAVDHGCDSQFHGLVCYKCNKAGAKFVVCEKCGQENCSPGGSTGSSCQDRRAPENNQ
ncbi:uncharacterized protein [Eurosta solidaginis]|uniref:uncharacterized protein n=1 Tax=Eurosta solidaginis TaxID=178769 RepID=UPI003530A2A8